MQCGEAELEKKIDEKIEQFVCWVEKHPNKKSQVSDMVKMEIVGVLYFDFVLCNYYFDWVVNWIVQICLSFYEVKNKQASWFSNKIERLYWEQWYINLNVAQHKVHSSKCHHPKVVDPGGAVACSVCQTKSLMMFHSY